MPVKTMGKTSRALGGCLGIPYGKSAFTLGAAGCVALIIAWAIAILTPYGWHAQDSIVWTYHLSLYSFSAQRNENAVKADQHHAVNKLSQLFDKMEERDDDIWLSVARWEFCQQDINSNWCEYFYRLQIASWALLSLVVLGVICLVMGVMAGVSFHYVKVRDNLHKWATAYLIVAPVAFQIGMVQYWVMTRDFGNLIGETGSTFSWMFYLALITSLVSWIPSWILIAFSFRFSWDEDSGFSDEERLMGGTFSEENTYGAIGMFEGFKDTLSKSFGFSPAGGAPFPTERIEGGTASDTDGGVQSSRDSADRKSVV